MKQAKLKKSSTVAWLFCVWPAPGYQCTVDIIRLLFSGPLIQLPEDTLMSWPTLVVYSKLLRLQYHTRLQYATG